MTGRPIDHVPSLFDREAMKILVMTHLSIPTETKASVVTNAGARVRLMWLEDLYHRYVESNPYVWVAMTYPLHLINSKILVDKSSTHVHIAYLQYLDNLDTCHEYAWRIGVLAYLYDHLSYTSQYNNKQCGGYMTLLMVRKLF